MTRSAAYRSNRAFYCSIGQLARVGQLSVHSMKSSESSQASHVMFNPSSHASAQDQRTMTTATTRASEHSKTTMSTPCWITSLPADVLKHVISFLNYRDAWRTSQMNSSFEKTLSLSTLEAPLPTLRSANWTGGITDGDIPHRSVQISMIFPDRTHSVVLTCQWRDQGWGNRKGELFVIAIPKSIEPEDSLRSVMDNGKMVYISPTVAHEWTSLRISFNPVPSVTYYLWYKVGGGGGHALSVQNLETKSIIYDDPGKWISFIYDTLKTHDAVQKASHFYLKLLHATAQTLCEQSENDRELEIHLVSMLWSCGIPVNRFSMRALGDVALGLLDLPTAP